MNTLKNFSQFFWRNLIFIYHYIKHIVKWRQLSAAKINLAALRCF
ncbi:MAG TPA: hypothetical protein GXZ92_06040 [Clostridiales bacterium]|nr:hypothetical protein [Clostridiales bacterium]